MEQYTRDGLTFDLSDSGPSGAEVIVLLHGFPANRHCWDAVTPGLVGHGFRVLVPDQRGYSPGARPPRRRDYRMPELVADVVALIDAAGAQRVHLVGHDWGGAVGWAFASTHPERLHTFTSLATPHPTAVTRAFVRSRQLLQSWYMLAFQLPALPERAFQPPLQGFLRRQLVASGLPAETAERYLGPLADTSAARAALNWYRAMPLSRPLTGRIQVPTLYAYPTGDVALGRTAADLTRDYVAGPYRYEVLEGVSHWIPEEAPETVVSLVAAHARAHQ